MRTVVAIFALGVSGAIAEEQDILPSEFPVTRYAPIWEDSPFNREVVAQINTKPRSAFASNFVLEGLVTDENAGSIAYVRDLSENQFLAITKKKDEKTSLFLVGAKKGTNPAETVVTISDGKETAEIRYAEGVFTKAIEAPPAPKQEDPKSTATTPGGGAARDADKAKAPENTGETPESESPQAGADESSAPTAERKRPRIILPSKPPASSGN